MPKEKKLKITLKKSVIAIHPKHKACVRGLGLKRLHHSTVVPDNPYMRGMINKVNYLLLVEEA